MSPRLSNSKLKCQHAGQAGAVCAEQGGPTGLPGAAAPVAWTSFWWGCLFHSCWSTIPWAHALSQPLTLQSHSPSERSRLVPLAWSNQNNCSAVLFQAPLHFTGHACSCYWQFVAWSVPCQCWLKSCPLIAGNGWLSCALYDATCCSLICSWKANSSPHLLLLPSEMWLISSL